MTHKTESLGTIWVCEDCLTAAEIGTYPDGATPWILLTDGEMASAGMLWDEHDETCPNRETGDWITECECETQTFSWSPCQGCGSGMGGTRHAYTLWAR